MSFASGKNPVKTDKNTGIYTCMRTCAHTCHMNVPTCACTFAHVQAYTLTCTHKHTHTHTHTHIHTRTQTHTQCQRVVEKRLLVLVFTVRALTLQTSSVGRSIPVPQHPAAVPRSWRRWPVGTPCGREVAAGWLQPGHSGWHMGTGQGIVLSERDGAVATQGKQGCCQQWQWQ